MTTNPPEEPQAPGTPPPSDTPAGPPPGAVPPPAYGTPPAGGYQQPPAGGYQQPPAGGYQQPPAGGYAPQGGYPPPLQAPLTDAEQRQWAMFAHLGGILFSFLPPLIIWLMYKERGRFVEEQSKEALNFQITLAIAYVVSSILTVVLIGAVLLLAVWVAAIVFGIMAGMAANRGEAYRYPVNIRLVK